MGCESSSAVMSVVNMGVNQQGLSYGYSRVYIKINTFILILIVFFVESSNISMNDNCVNPLGRRGRIWPK